MTESVSDLLTAIIATGLSFGGLAGLISLFRRGEDFNIGEIMIFRAIILGSLFITCGGFLPFLFFEIFEEPNQIWAASSILYAVGVGILLGTDLRRMQLGLLVVNHWLIAVILILGSASMIFLALVNAFLWQTTAIFSGGLIWGIVVLSARLYLFLVTVTSHRLNELKETELPL